MVKPPARNPSARVWFDRASSQTKAGEIPALGVGNRSPLANVAALASAVCNLPVALVTITEDRLKWLEPSIETDLAGAAAFEHFIESADVGDEILVVPDTQSDSRFSGGRFGEPPEIRFYAAFPLCKKDGSRMGTLHLFDREPNSLTVVQIDTVRRIARCAETEIEGALTAAALAAANHRLSHEIDERTRLEQILRELIPNGEISPEARLQFVQQGSAFPENGGPGNGFTVPDAANAADRTVIAPSERARLFEAFMSRSPALAFIKNEEGRILYINSAVALLWNVTPSAWIGKTSAELWPPEIAGPIQEIDRRVLAEGKDTEDVEILPLPGGELRQFQTLRFLFKDVAGRGRVCGMALDVTERNRADSRFRAALDEKDVLLKEVHHRVKNNLQVVSSLLSLQARAAGDDRTRDLFLHNQSRVYAMAQVHEELCKSEDFRQIPMSDYLRKIFFYQASIHDSERLQIEIVFEAPGEIYLPADRAIPCGLIVNELISNSFKHAFPNRPGKILVTLDRHSERMKICVRDDGVGLPAGFSLAGSRSLGLKVVQILARQLDGSLSIPDGAGCCFEFDLPIEQSKAATVSAS